jgi:hypothetical protein
MAFPPAWSGESVIKEMGKLRLSPDTARGSDGGDGILLEVMKRRRTELRAKSVRDSDNRVGVGGALWS